MRVRGGLVVRVRGGLVVRMRGGLVVRVKGGLVVRERGGLVVRVKGLVVRVREGQNLQMNKDISCVGIVLERIMVRIRNSSKRD